MYDEGADTEEIDEGAQIVKEKADEYIAIYNVLSLMTTNVGVITLKQTAIWISITFAIISAAAVYALFAIDDRKNRDTILNAKFITNHKNKDESANPNDIL